MHGERVKFTNAQGETSNFKSVYSKRRVVLQSNSCTLVESEQVFFSFFLFFSFLFILHWFHTQAHHCVTTVESYPDYLLTCLPNMQPFQFLLLLRQILVSLLYSYPLLFKFIFSSNFLSPYSVHIYLISYYYWSSSSFVSLGLTFIPQGVVSPL